MAIAAVKPNEASARKSSKSVSSGRSDQRKDVSDRTNSNRFKADGVRKIGKLWVRMRADAKGRIVIPAEMREALGIEDGTMLDMKVVDGELRIATFRERLRQAQERVRHLVPAGTLVSEELSAERREAAKYE
jgi:AbrB family looped-hinge helix DNA binding protein